jgi:hypothetical protein
MRKRAAITSSHRLSFDLLEARSLLSGGFTVSPGSPASVSSHPVAVSPVYSEHAFPRMPGFYGSPFSQEGARSDRRQPWLSQPAGIPQPDDDGAVLNQRPDFPQQQFPGAPPPPMSPDGDAVPGPSEPSSSPQIGSSVVVVTGLFGAAPARNQSGPNQSTPVVLDEVGVEAEAYGGGLRGVPAISAIDVNLEPSSVSSNLAGSGASSLPAQLLSSVNADTSSSASLRSQPVASVGNDARQEALLLTGSRLASPIIGRAALRPAVVDSARPDGNELDQLSRPASADLIASMFPVNRASLEKAIDRFFPQIDGLKVRDMVRQGPLPVVLLALALSSTLTALELVRRRWARRKTSGDVRLLAPAASGDLVGFPELPASWSTRLS